MTYQGTVKNGVVVFEADAPPPEGTRVDVRIHGSIAEEASSPMSETAAGDSWVDAVMKFAGTGTDLPPDLAAEHDHYIHGTPRRSPSPE